MPNTHIVRYRMDAVLKTASPLHIGSGTDREFQVRDQKGNFQPVRVSEVYRDIRGLPYIPGSSIKGHLRSKAETMHGYESVVHRLFGTEKEGMEQGGLLLFQDALMDLDQSVTPEAFKTDGGKPAPMYWDKDKFSYIMTGTAVNRMTRTVERHKLYYYEAVPSGAAFRMIICGECLLKDELYFIMSLLESQNRFVMGGETVHGFGELICRDIRLSGLTNEHDVKEWLNSSSAGFEGFKPLTDDHSRTAVEADSQSADITLKVDLIFDSPFMVNDPSQVQPKENDREEKEGTDHLYLKDERGRIVLKSRSFHGAFRSQAERIVRTIAPDNHRIQKACYVETTDKSCKPVYEIGQVKNLCLACRLFGGNGWRSPVSISDFTASENTDGIECSQEFVAIDRFTGGAADQKKFNATYRYKPVLTGTIRINLCRIDASLAGLLALTLRDLAQGDIQFGFGRSKGFGRCKAVISGVGLPADPDAWLQIILEWLKELIGSADEIRQLLSTAAINHTQRQFLKQLAEAFQKEVQSNGIS